ncbi:MAG: (2Fe-2S)-binding protein [Armatimonas sp.]
MKYNLTVNGKAASVDVPADMPLLWVLRDLLDLPGTKYGCGIGMCGACTVLVEGQPVKSCSRAISEVAGKKVTTIEGLHPTGAHPLQMAWQELDVPQCGYCQAGQIMAASALLAKKPRPTEKDIDQAMEGNLCRCGTYPAIKAAILKAAGVKK